MHFVYKLGIFLICLAVSSATTEEEELKCNLKICGAELLNFETFSFRDLYKKVQYATFCVKNCTPTVVHEFFHSIIFSITKRIPGHCSGDECIDKNRFVALAKCVEDEAWSLLQCSKTLIDLAHIGLVANPAEERRNTTCDIVSSTVQCIEETLLRCGEKPFHLVKEILSDLIRVGITAYCHPEYKKQGLFMKRTTAPYNNLTTSDVTEGPGYIHPKFVKGYRQGDGALGFPSLSYICLLMSVFSSVIISVHLIH